jgi:hypothetical protein
MEKDMAPLSDEIVIIQQLVLHERQGRDRGRWAQMAETFHPDSRVRVTWFEGTGAEFTAESEKRAAAGRRTPVHHIAAPIITLHGNRGLAEVACSIHHRFPIHGVRADLTSHTRLLYRVDRLDADWRIRSLDCIYESDALVPVMPGEGIDFDDDLLSGMRDSYRYLAYHLAINSGRVPPDDLYGDDRPDGVQVLYAEAFEWLEDDQ